MNSSDLITVRPINKGELLAVYQLEQQLFGAHSYPDFFFRQCYDCWPSGLKVAVDRQDSLLGYILIAQSEQADCAWLLSVAVARSAQGNGVGKRLILDAMATVPVSVTSIKLTVAPTNPARYLYLALGFVEVNLEKDYFGAGEDRLLMVLNRSI